MQYDASSPKEYLHQLDDDWRKEKLLSIRESILSTDPDLDEGIQYKMLNYGNTQGNLFYLNAQKNYVSLYVGNIKKIDNEGAMLKDFDMGKGCIRIKKSIPADHPGLKQFIEKAIRIHNKGGDTNC